MTTEQIIQVLREQGYILDLSSTHIGARSKYSAKFFHKSDEECDECCCNIPNAWDDYSHAETMEEAVLQAANAIEPPNILIIMGDDA